jgi:AcrR family transcriptional regulator
MVQAALRHGGRDPNYPIRDYFTTRYNIIACYTFPVTLHEQNKQRNRDRILAAADTILRDEGLQRLSMRHLAEVAGVSLRTPYNLFGSKTAILAELLTHTLDTVVPAQTATGPMGTLLGFLDGLKAAQPALDDHLRSLFWSIMTAPEQALRDVAIEWITAVLQPRIAAALASGELKPTATVDAMTRHLVVLILGIFGMWAGRQLGIEEALAQVEQACCEALAVHSADHITPELLRRLGAGK